MLPHQCLDAAIVQHTHQPPKDEKQVTFHQAHRNRCADGGKNVKAGRVGNRFLAAAREGNKDSVFCLPADAAGTLAVTVACEDALASGGTVKVTEHWR